jgi:hypothetical protein
MKEKKNVLRAKMEGVVFPQQPLANSGFMTDYNYGI